jgi:hypothetical protein
MLRTYSIKNILVRLISNAISSTEVIAKSISEIGFIIQAETILIVI